MPSATDLMPTNERKRIWPLLGRLFSIGVLMFPAYGAEANELLDPGLAIGQACLIAYNSGGRLVQKCSSDGATLFRANDGMYRLKVSFSADDSGRVYLIEQPRISKSDRSAFIERLMQSVDACISEPNCQNAVTALHSPHISDCLETGKHAVATNFVEYNASIIPTSRSGQIMICELSGTTIIALELAWPPPGNGESVSFMNSDGIVAFATLREPESDGKN